jgi:hypothetical protein
MLVVGATVSISGKVLVLSQIQFVSLFEVKGPKGMLPKPQTHLFLIWASLKPISG